MFSFSGNPILSWIAFLPLGILFGTALFTVRYYTVTPEAILVRRLLWETTLPIKGLLQAEFEPNAMKSSLRIGGNGGLFSFSGFFMNQSLGTYRALVTDPTLSVVLKYPDRKVVISPATPAEFVRDLTERLAP